MKVLNVTEVARNFRAVMDGVESNQEEIVLTRNHKAIARIMPEPAAQNAMEVLGDLYRTLDDATADSLSKAVRQSKTSKRGTLRELRDPWAT